MRIRESAMRKKVKVILLICLCSMIFVGCMKSEKNVEDKQEQEQEETTQEYEESEMELD